MEKLRLKVDWKAATTTMSRDGVDVKVDAHFE
jgi:hypothetical protein